MYRQCGLVVYWCGLYWSSSAGLVRCVLVLCGIGRNAAVRSQALNCNNTRFRGRSTNTSSDKHGYACTRSPSASTASGLLRNAAVRLQALNYINMRFPTSAAGAGVAPADFSAGALFAAGAHFSAGVGAQFSASATPGGPAPGEPGGPLPVSRRAFCPDAQGGVLQTRYAGRFAPNPQAPVPAKSHRAAHAARVTTVPDEKRDKFCRKKIAPWKFRDKVPSSIPAEPSSPETTQAQRPSVPNDLTGGVSVHGPQALSGCGAAAGRYSRAAYRARGARDALPAPDRRDRRGARRVVYY